MLYEYAGSLDADLMAAVDDDVDEALDAISILLPVMADRGRSCKAPWLRQAGRTS